MSKSNLDLRFRSFFHKIMALVHMNDCDDDDDDGVIPELMSRHVPPIEYTTNLRNRGTSLCPNMKEKTSVERKDN